MDTENAGTAGTENLKPSDVFQTTEERSIAAAEEAAVEKVAMAATTLGRDLLEHLIGEIRILDRPWSVMSQADQDQVIERLRRRVIEGVRAAIGILSKGTADAIPGTVESVVFKDGIKAVLKIPKAAKGRHALADREGGDVMVLIIDPSDYLVGINAVQGESDQPNLPGIQEAADEAIAKAAGTKPVDPNQPSGSL